MTAVEARPVDPATAGNVASAARSEVLEAALVGGFKPTYEELAEARDARIAQIHAEHAKPPAPPEAPPEIPALAK